MQHATLVEDLTLAENEQKISVQALAPRVEVDTSAFPTLAQCIGSKRLWGARLGLAFFLDTAGGTKQPDDAAFAYQRIAYLSRAYLVIDDFLHDEDVSDEHRQFSFEWLKKLRTAIKSTIANLDGDPDEFDEQLMRAERAFHKRDSKIERINLMKNSIDKCEIFFNPYKLHSLQICSNLRQERIDFLDRFFAICQSFDDFHDIEEDMKKEKNHNLYLQSTTRNHGEINAIRHSLAPSLVYSASGLIKRGDSLTSQDANEIFRHYKNHSRRWLAWKLASLSASEEYIFQDLNLVNWSFCDETVDRLSAMSYFVSTDDYIDDIRPEFLQTYFSGVRSISDL